jgi:hypothetical protein
MRDGRPRGVDCDKHQGRCRQHQGYDHKRAHYGRIDAGHHPSLTERFFKIGVSRVARSMIRISITFDFGLDGRKRLGRVDVSQCGSTSDRHFDNRLGIIADKVAGSNVASNAHQIVEEAA